MQSHTGRRSTGRWGVVIRAFVVVVVAAAPLAPDGTVLAKGPESVTITGPGIERTIQLWDMTSGKSNEREAGKLAYRLLTQTGMWSERHGDRISKPASDLGRRYTVSIVWPGQSRDDLATRQYVYPDAVGGPVVHTPADQNLHGWGSDVIGWFTAPVGVKDTLADLGVPTTQAFIAQASLPTSRSSSSLFPLVSAAIAVALGATLWMWIRRHRRVSRPSLPSGAR